MHINRKPAEQVEVDWAGDPAHIIDPDTGEILDAHIFVGVMTYSQYPYVEAFMDEKQPLYISDKLTILHGQSDHLSRRFRSLISERDSRRSKSFL